MGPSDPELDPEDVKVIKDVTNDIIDTALRAPDVGSPENFEDDLDCNNASAIKFAQEGITPGFEEVDLDSFCSSPDTTEDTEGYREDGPPDSLKRPEKPFEEASEKQKTEDNDTYSCDDPPQRLHPDPISRSQSRISNASSKHKISWGHVDNMAGGLTLSLPNNEDVDDDRSRKQSQLSNVSSPSLVSIAMTRVLSRHSPDVFPFPLVRVPEQRAALRVGGVASSRLPSQAQQAGSHEFSSHPPNTCQNVRCRPLVPA